MVEREKPTNDMGDTKPPELTREDVLSLFVEALISEGIKLRRGEKKEQTKE